MKDILIDLKNDKDPYMKKLTDDKIVNLTGESGSGKSYFSNKYINDDDYIVIDTDLIFVNKPTDNKYILELRTIFEDKEKDYLITNFDECYKIILNCFKNVDKTLVIDSAQYRNIKDYSILKGKIIVMRTSIDTCYKRCIDRWKKLNKDYTAEELKKYSNKKLGIYSWYKSLNKFLEKIDNLNFDKL